MDRFETAQSRDVTQASHMEWRTGSNFSDSAVDVATLQDHTIAGDESLVGAKHSRNSSLEAELQTQSSQSPVLPADYEDTEHIVGLQTSITPEIAALSDKFRQLGAAAWALEQDESMDKSKHKKISNILQHLERLMQDKEPSNFDSETSQNEGQEQEQEQEQEEDEDEEDYIDEQQLHQVHDSLLSTVHEMRMRTQEHKHLHSLTVVKLDNITQQCASQSDQIIALTTAQDTLNLQNTDMRTECNSLRHENHILGIENDTLRLRGDELQAHIKALQAEVQRQSVALTAMTSAVTGLEEWMDYHKSTTTNDIYAPSPQARRHNGEAGTNSNNKIINYDGRNGAHMSNGYTQRSRSNGKPRTVVRGIGRFRGRYQVDVDDDGGDDEEDEYIDGLASGRNHQSRVFNGGDYFNTSTAGYQQSNYTNGHGNGYPSDLQDDVRAWIRGCRDVLECAQAGAESLPSINLSADPDIDIQSPLKNDRNSTTAEATAADGLGEGDDWGEFETA